MFILQSRITIGDKAFNHITDVTVSRSVNHIAAMAVVKMPVSSVSSSTDGRLSGRTATAGTIQPGDPVKIELAYDSEWHTEFQGYIREIRNTIPLEIVCEDEYYQTRSKETSLSGQAVKLSDLLADCGLSVGKAADLELKNFVADKVPLCRVLQRLRTEFDLKVFFDTESKVYALADNEYRLSEVKYELRKNVIAQKAYGLTTFLQPFAEPCMTAVLTDAVYPERNGKFFIEAVQVLFGMNGARRIISLGEPA